MGRSRTHEFPALRVAVEGDLLEWIAICGITYYNVATPEFGPDWSIRLQCQLLFPK